MMTKAEEKRWELQEELSRLSPRTEKALALINDIDAEVKGKNADRPLIWAANRGCTEVVRVLLDKGADPSFVGTGENTPLIWAAYHGRLEIARMLIEKGARLDQKDGHGSTALDYAVSRGHTEIAALLKEKATANQRAALLRDLNENGVRLRQPVKPAKQIRIKPRP